MNKKITLTSLLAAATVIGGASYIFLEHGKATASTQAIAKKDVARSQDGTGATLPGGASALNETYQDWRLVCQQGGTGSSCVISQQEFDGKTHQRIVSVELRPTAGQMSGVIVLPFGIALNKGAEIQADGKAVGNALSFNTCLPAGCLVPVSFDQIQLKIFQNAKKVEIKFSAISGQQIVLPLSNKGLDKAILRIMALSH
ncbi:invasion associated locus B family protein [Acetobacter orientalis]|uniref:invasion associated locus B family protein n=1 Tax=Acetobacter orientalis TaxID=146474 RepID=UPI000A39C284|nr:invasion associated locus B family protein [Acetobacter orientalis]